MNSISTHYPQTPSRDTFESFLNDKVYDDTRATGKMLALFDRLKDGTLSKEGFIAHVQCELLDWREEEVRDFVSEAVKHLPEDVAGSLRAQFKPPSLLKMALIALLHLVAPVKAKETADPWPCEGLMNVSKMVQVNNQWRAQRLNPYDDSPMFDKHCEVIRELDPKAHETTYVFTSNEDMKQVFGVENAVALYHRHYQSIIVSPQALPDPGEEAFFRMTVRHELRHQQVHARNLQARGAVDNMSDRDPCEIESNPKVCREDILAVRELIEKLKNLGKVELQPGTWRHLFRAAELLPDSLSVEVNSSELENIRKIFPEAQTPDETARSDGKLRIVVPMPEGTDKRGVELIKHLLLNPQTMMDSYDQSARSLPQKDGEHLRVYEYDAILIGYYGEKATAALIDAARNEARFLPNDEL